TPEAEATSPRTSPLEPPASSLGPRTSPLRFRRGSRSLVRPPEIPLVGVVRVEPRAGVESSLPNEEKPKRKPAPRRRNAPRVKKDSTR
ncbi:MAG TPA: hypothetical protein VJK71_06230, partial [Gemmatimonadales bacterium]|nr:hypothetical protein [Gemmatimonadales bacterium]